MSRIQVRPIELPRDATKFIKAWWPIYEGDAHWVPPLIFERKMFFDPAKNPFTDPEGYRAYVAQKEKAFRDTLAGQQEAKPRGPGQ